MSIILITGSGGLIGRDASLYFGSKGYDIVGIDNDMRSYFFGAQASTRSNVAFLERQLGRRYRHYGSDVRDEEALETLFRKFRKSVAAIIHTAAQPSHDWAARQPLTDFTVNALATVLLLECARRHCPDAPFIFLSTNKVYGDHPNYLPLRKLETRYELDAGHGYWNGIAEDMSIDQCTHSVFGCSKASADLLVQEYGRYFGMKTVCFRGGTLTGGHHAAAELHGFLAYVIRCAITGKAYTIYGYDGKQVRDVIHSYDVVRAFDVFLANPRCGEVYNLGGGRSNNLSVLEAIELAQTISGRRLETRYEPKSRVGDHIWWISSNEKFISHFPDWGITRNLFDIAEEIAEFVQCQGSGE